MREILFRGKRVDNGEWVIGYYVQKQDPLLVGAAYHCILTQEKDSCGCLMSTVSWYNVTPESIGQYTGVKDKNGKRVYEGDIVVAHITQNALTHTEKYKGIYEVKYHDKHCYFYLAKRKNNILFDGNWRYFLSEIEVIGNIHDNPELLEAK